MTKSANYVIAMTLILVVLLLDFYGVASLAASTAILASAAIVLVSAGLRSAAKVSDWFPAKRAKQQMSFGSMSSMVMLVEGAADGYSFSREELANLLAAAFAVRSGESLQPNYHIMVKARERLIVRTRGDSKTKEIFDAHPSSQPRRFRFRQRRDYEYLSGLKSAIRMVREG